MVNLNDVSFSYSVINYSITRRGVFSELRVSSHFDLNVNDTVKFIYFCTFIMQKELAINSVLLSKYYT